MNRFFPVTIVIQYDLKALCLLYAPWSTALIKINMVLEHIKLEIFFEIVNGTGPYGPEANGPGS